MDGYGRQPLKPTSLNTGHHATAVTLAAENKYNHGERTSKAR
jgi:hypothetical protein